MLQQAEQTVDADELIKVAEQQAAVALDTDEQRAELHRFMHVRHVRELDLDEGSSIGYTYKCMGAGLLTLRHHDFVDALMPLILQCGGRGCSASLCELPDMCCSFSDADTNGAVAGALLGCKLGLSGLPTLWLEQLVHAPLLAGYAARLCQRMGLAD